MGFRSFSCPSYLTLASTRSLPDCHISSPLISLASNNEAERNGEIDEGFDEEFEFCDGEDLGLSRDLEPSTGPSLDMQDIQHLLVEGAIDSDAIPSSALLDDFDLGVDVFDSEQSTHSLFDLDPVKSPVAHVPSSPYYIPVGSPAVPSSPCHVPVGSPAIPTADIETLTLNDYNEFLTRGHHPRVSLSQTEYSEYGSLGSVGTLASQRCGSQSHCEELDTLYSMCDIETSLATLGVPQAATTYSTPSASCLSVGAPNSGRITLEATLHIDLPSPMTATKILFATDHHHQTASHSNMVPSTSPSPVPAPSPLISRTSGNFMCMATGGAWNCGSSGENMDTGGFTVKSEDRNSCCSRGSQTLQSRSMPSMSQTRSASPTFANGCSDSKPSLNGASEVLPPSGTKKLIEMPFYEFKKILDSPSVADQEKVEVKNVRRRGKNKVAAKNCRQRKLEVIFGLQKEIEQLKAAKSKVAVRSQKLQQEIEALRRRCTLAKQSGSIS